MSQLFTCPDCGCLDVEGQSWYHLNSGEESGPAGEDVWCPHCEENYRFPAHWDEQRERYVGGPDHPKRKPWLLEDGPGAEQD